MWLPSGILVVTFVNIHHLEYFPLHRTRYSIRAITIFIILHGPIGPGPAQPTYPWQMHLYTIQHWPVFLVKVKTHCLGSHTLRLRSQLTLILNFNAIVSSLIPKDQCKAVHAFQLELESCIYFNNSFNNTFNNTIQRYHMR